MEKSENVWNFVSAPKLHPMKVTINQKSKKTQPGLIFVAPYTMYGTQMIGQTGSLIMDQKGNPIWFAPLETRYKQNTDFRVQMYKHKPVLTMWEGTISGTQSDNPNLPDGDPEPGAYFKIIDQNYALIKKITAQKDFTSDVHEFTITKRGTALFTANQQVKADLTPYGGPANGYIDNYSIQEIDIETNQLIFFWNTLDHVNPANSMVPASSTTNNIWDCFHVNSVEINPNNHQTLLVSMRNMWAIYNIDHATGQILWQLGGKESLFTFAPNANFSWQHNARWGETPHSPPLTELPHSPPLYISLFDDASSGSSTQGPSRGLILKLDFQKKEAKVHRTYYHDPQLSVASQGNLQTLCNGQYLIGWGQEPYVSEFANPGNTVQNPAINFLYDMQFPNQNCSYRAYKNEWVGLPLDPPSIAIKNHHCEDKTKVYASWNGSTETVAWQVLAGSKPEKMKVVIKKEPKKGFETKMKTKSRGPYFQIKAINSKGKIIGQSQILKV
jgi:hypothetical protein